MLYVEDIRNYIHCKMKSTGVEVIHKDLGFMCNNDLPLKSEYVHLENYNLVKYMFYIEFKNHEWT